MKKLALVVLAVLAVTCSRAEASTFVLDSYTVSLHTTGAGLQVWEKDILTDPFEIKDLTAGSSRTYDLFELGTNENSVEIDDWKPYSIAVNFDFSIPEPGFGGNAQGMTGAIDFFGHELAYVLWDNPLKLAFGTTGLMEIYLSQNTFKVPGSTIIAATFKLVRDDSGIPTPEPASALLIGLGATAVGIARRRRIV